MVKNRNFHIFCILNVIVLMHISSYNCPIELWLVLYFRQDMQLQIHVLQGYIQDQMVFNYYEKPKKYHLYINYIRKIPKYDWSF